MEAGLEDRCYPSPSFPQTWIGTGKCGVRKGNESKTSKSSLDTGKSFQEDKNRENRLIWLGWWWGDGAELSSKYSYIPQMFIKY